MGVLTIMEKRKGLQLQAESCDVKRLVGELMINCSSPRYMEVSFMKFSR